MSHAFGLIVSRHPKGKGTPITHMRGFLERHQLPLPSTANPMFLTSSTLLLCTSDGEHKFEVPSEIVGASSPMIRALLEDADADGPVVLPLGIPCASLAAVSILTSWWYTSSPLDPMASEVVPVVDVTDTPGTTGLRGSKVVEACLRDAWCIKVLEKLFPIDKRQVVIPKAEVFTNAPGESTLTVAYGIHGLQLLYHVTQLATFLNVRKLVELCSSYMLNGLQHCLRDERAFGVAHRLQGAAPPQHIAVDIVSRSLRLPPAGWDPAEAYNIVGGEDLGTEPPLESMVDWLRETATGMSLQR